MEVILPESLKEITQKSLEEILQVFSGWLREEISRHVHVGIFNGITSVSPEQISGEPHEKLLEQISGEFEEFLNIWKSL